MDKDKEIFYPIALTLEELFNVYNLISFEPELSSVRERIRQTLFDFMYQDWLSKQKENENKQ